MWKICVIQETRKTKHNLVSLHPVSERIWTARPTLDLLLPSLMWPCVFQAAQTLSCNTYHPNYPMVADYAILLGSWSSGLNQSLETSPTSFLTSFCIFMQNVGGSTVISLMSVLQQGQRGWIICRQSVMSVSDEFPRGYQCSSCRLTLPTGTVSSLVVSGKKEVLYVPQTKLLLSAGLQKCLSVLCPYSKAEELDCSFCPFQG